ncbi:MULTISPECIES: TRAP transporter small permease [Desulfosediminicola]|uniref:TRAP transporter small permease n=1 Tax=Desulfosediminicola TaxID=2886823 RepID=UPI0010AD9C41|nr:TRAP transporter small permease [Desulfosediminicola ganghwensis]
MLKLIDTTTTFFAKLAAWMFFVIGGIIVYEVIARYLFFSPTIWSEEISRFLQIWATYLAAAYILHQRKLIAIDVVVSKMPHRAQQFFESLSLVIIAIFSSVACIYGIKIVIASVKIGRATSTMMAVPSWMTEIAIPIGFGLLLLQCLAELYRTIFAYSQPNTNNHH